MKKIITLAGATLLLLASTAQGIQLDVGDPAVNPDVFLFVQPGQTAPSEVIQIPTLNLGIYERINGNSGNTAIQDLKLILALPNEPAGYLAPNLDWAGVAPLSSTGSATAADRGHYLAPLPGHGNPSVYDFLGLSGGSNSANYGNLSAADTQVNGITPTAAGGFGIWVYDLLNTGISGGNTVNVTFDEDLLRGTFAIAYGVDATGRVFSTPFTVAGLTTDDGGGGGGTPVPEPGTMVLFGSGLVGLALYRKRRSER